MINWLKKFWVKPVQKIPEYNQGMVTKILAARAEMTIKSMTKDEFFEWMEGQKMNNKNDGFGEDGG